MVYIVWIGGVCAHDLLEHGGQGGGGRAAAIFLNIMPLVGVVLGVTLLGEDFAFREAFGAVGILGGVYILTHSRQIMRRMDQRLIRRAPGAGGRPPAGCGKGIPPGLRPADGIYQETGCRYERD